MGRLVLIAGSRGMAGAAALSAEASLRSGAGYAVLVSPSSISAELTAAIPSAVLKLAGNPECGHLKLNHQSLALEESSKANAIALGPGLGQDPETFAFVLSMLPLFSIPCVIDADGLNALATSPFVLSSNFVLTPHPGEAARLLGLKSAMEVQSNRERVLSDLVDKFQATVLLKGEGTLVGSPGKEVWKNETGNPGMATAGSGDVLTGILGALLARGMEAWEATRLSAHLHGLAGDFAAYELGEESLIASDILKSLPRAIQEYGANR